MQEKHGETVSVKIVCARDPVQQNGCHDLLDPFADSTKTLFELQNVFDRAPMLVENTLVMSTFMRVLPQSSIYFAIFMFTLHIHPPILMCLLVELHIQFIYDIYVLVCYSHCIVYV